MSSGRSITGVQITKSLKHGPKLLKVLERCEVDLEVVGNGDG